MLLLAGAAGAQMRGRGGPCPQPGSSAPIAGSPMVEITGKISRVNIQHGQGMPAIDVAKDGRATTVQLGAMHYLIAQDFNPKAGDEVSVKGYKAGDIVLASSVTLAGAKRTLKLRDEKGWPLWRGGGRCR